MGNGNFKVRCVEPRNNIAYTKGKIYEIIDGKITDDNGYRMPILKVKSFEELVNWSSAEWELAEEDFKQETNTYFKARCIATKDCALNVGKIYEFINGYSKFDFGTKMPNRELNGITQFVNFSDLEKWFGEHGHSKFEEVIEDAPKAKSQPFDWDGFKSAKFVVHCDTEEKAKQFFDELKIQGIKWCSGRELTDTNWNRYKEETCYVHGNFGLEYSPKEFFRRIELQVIPYVSNFSEIKRPAKVDEWIKVINVEGYKFGNYELGDIMRVDRYYSTCEIAECDFNGSKCRLTIDDYVVLESCQPEEPIQEEPYKVDWSKVTNKEIAEELLRRYQED